jgi:hypothetical protein
MKQKHLAILSNGLHLRHVLELVFVRSLIIIVRSYFPLKRLLSLLLSLIVDDDPHKRTGRSGSCLVVSRQAQQAIAIAYE